jgi:MFS family permease
MEAVAPALTTAAMLDVPPERALSKEEELELEDGSSATDELVDQTNLLPPSRIILVFFALGTGVLLSILEASIMATSLSTISAALGAGTKGSWIVTSYLLAQCALCPCWGRLSDILGEFVCCWIPEDADTPFSQGRKVLLLFCLGEFLLSSLACSLVCLFLLSHT